MVGIKNNRRTKYTQKVIKEAVLSLLEQKSIDAITVIDVCSIADVNRSTFYRYYDDIYACVDAIEMEFIETINIPDDCTPRQAIETVLSAFYKNPTLSNLAFVEGKTKLLEKMHNVLAPEEDEQPYKFNDYQETYIMTGMQGVLRKWVKEGMKESPQELAEIIWNLFLLKISERQSSRKIKKELKIMSLL